MLKMNIVSLVFAITMNYLLIPLFGIAGAALSSMSYQILQCVWMNVYLVKMGYWPYKKSLFVQGSLILILALFYIGLNQGISLSVASKIVTYSIAVLVILAVFYFQGLFGKKYSRKKNR
jgi:O-antigen/teichoic acid export membrane protein